MEIYTSDLKQINIRAADIYDGTVLPCTDCYNFTVREALSSLSFMQSLIGVMSIDSINEEQIEDCEKRTYEIRIIGLKGRPYFNSSFES